MKTQIETPVQLAQDQVDFRALLDVEVLFIGGGEAAVALS